MSKRLELYGKAATKEEIAKEVSKLLVGDVNRNIPPQPISKILVTLGFETRKSFYDYKKLAIQNGYLETDEHGAAKLPEIPEEDFNQFTESHPITIDPLVKEWMEDLLVRRNGSPKANWKYCVRSVEVVCNTCKIKPSQLIQSKDATEKIMKNFSQRLQSGEIDKKYVNKGLTLDIAGAVHGRKMAVRDFCAYYGITWRKGIGGIMSGKVRGHGQYSSIRFSAEEFEKTDKYIKENYGLDSDFFRLFWFAIESGARHKAIMNTRLEWSESVDPETNEKIFLMTVIEEKTKHVRGGKWTKYIRYPDLQQSLLRARSRGYSLLYDSTKFSVFGIEEFFKNEVKKLYKFLGRTEVFFTRRPVHALRHVAAQRYLRLYEFNLGVVARLVGSNTVDELEKSYGEMPPEFLMKKLRELSKNQVGIF